jgi:ATP-binding protein involved in chromosome partitioning
VLAVLERVIDPKSGRGLVSARLVHGLALGPGRVGFMLEVAAADAEAYAPVRDAAEAALRAMPGVTQAQVVLTAEGAPAQPYQPPPGTVRVRKGARLSNEAQAQMAPARPQGALKPDHVGAVLAVASGKGGVGKSTVAVNLACAFARLGYRTGLLDADVYGPSAPRLLGIDEEPEAGGDKKLKPLEAWGIKVISIGFLVDEGAPMIWRGPMASSAVNQFLNDVSWGSAEEPLDILVVDMPPGTGDIQLTLVQRVALAGAVLVSTPQEVALIDVRRGAAMFEKTATPILGVVENMAYFPDPATGEPIPIFGRGGAQATAGELGAPFLGEIPIDIALRQGGDDGRPIVAASPDSPTARAFMAIAADLAPRLGGETAKAPPRIVFED